MDVSGVIKKIFDEQRFDSGFVKREFVVTTQEQYPQDIKMELVKDKTSLVSNLKPGDHVKVHFNLRGSEWQEKYYVNLVAWKIDIEKGQESSASPAPHAADFGNPMSAPTLPAADDDDLPF